MKVMTIYQYWVSFTHFHFLHISHICKGGLHDTNTVTITKEILDPLLTKPLAQCAAAAIKNIKKPMIVLKILPDDGHHHSQHYIAPIKFGADTAWIL